MINEMSVRGLIKKIDSSSDAVGPFTDFCTLQLLFLLLANLCPGIDTVEEPQQLARRLPPLCRRPAEYLCAVHQTTFYT